MPRRDRRQLTSEETARHSTAWRDLSSVPQMSHARTTNVVRDSGMEACLAVPANSRLAKVANCDKTARRCTARRGLDIAARNISHKVLEPEVMQQLVCGTLMIFSSRTPASPDLSFPTILVPSRICSSRWEVRSVSFLNFAFKELETSAWLSSSGIISRDRSVLPSRLMVVPSVVLETAELGG